MLNEEEDNRKVADQIVFHLHVHVIPRHNERKSLRPREVVDATILDEVADRISTHL